MAEAPLQCQPAVVGRVLLMMAGVVKVLPGGSALVTAARRGVGRDRPQAACPPGSRAAVGEAGGFNAVQKLLTAKAGKAGKRITRIAPRLSVEPIRVQRSDSNAAVIVLA
jgi:hypothetical protein